MLSGPTAALFIVTAVFGVAGVVSTLGPLAVPSGGSLAANPTPDPDIRWTTGA